MCQSCLTFVNQCRFILPRVMTVWLIQLLCYMNGFIRGRDAGFSVDIVKDYAATLTDRSVQRRLRDPKRNRSFSKMALDNRKGEELILCDHLVFKLKNRQVGVGWTVGSSSKKPEECAILCNLHGWKQLHARHEDTRTRGATHLARPDPVWPELTCWRSAFSCGDRPSLDEWHSRNTKMLTSVKPGMLDTQTFLPWFPCPFVQPFVRIWYKVPSQFCLRGFSAWGSRLSVSVCLSVCLSDRVLFPTVTLVFHFRFWLICFLFFVVVVVVLFLSFSFLFFVFQSDTT